MVCPKCGRVLVPGEICECQKEEIRKRNIELMFEQKAKEEEEARIQAEKEAARAEKIDKAARVAEKAKNKTADVSDNIIQDIIAIIKNPISGIKEFVDNASFVNAIILIVLQSLFIGIFAASTFSSSLLGTIAMSLPTINKFMVGGMIFLTCVVGAFGNTLGFMLLSKMQKNSLDFTQCICLSAPKSILFIPLTLLSIVGVIINGGLGVACLILTLMSGVCMDSASLSLINVEKEKAPYCLLFIELITTIFTCLMGMVAINVIF